MTPEFWDFLFAIVLGFVCLFSLIILQQLFDRWGLTRVVKK